MGDAVLRGVRAALFDAYGTLFDVHSAVGRHRARLGPAADAVSALWRAKQLEYTWLRSLMGRYAEFGRVTADALDYALDAHGVSDAGLRSDLLEAFRALDPFPDAPTALAALRDRGLRLAILSNGSPPLLDAVVRHGGLGGVLDAVLSVDEVAVYKPDPRVYRLGVERLGVPAGETAFLSANAWDAAGAASFGLRAVWVNRSGARPERLPHGPEAVIGSLAELPGILGA